ncbi:SGNH/GDSL hydrolase family protein [Acidobacteriota bacterium]
MKRRKIWIFIAALGFIAGIAVNVPSAQSPVPLPKVLIIGDSISLGYTPFVKEILGGRAEVFHNTGNAQHTGTGLEKIHEWLGGQKWDVIHFNWGLWDLCYRHPEAKNVGNRDKVNGLLTHTLEQYEQNLRELVKILKTTGAVLIWCSTTPVPEGEAGRIKGDEIEYNRVAGRIMGENGIPINDLHSFALLGTPEIQAGEGNVHFTKDGSRYLAERVAESIMKVYQKR